MTRYLRKASVAIGLLVGAVLGSAIGFGGGVPLLPSSPQFNEPSQIVSTLNAFINQLNGNPLGSGGYAAQPGGIVSIGALCQPAAGASPQTCNGSRGLVAFTGITVAATGTTQNLVINDSLVLATSACQAQWITAFTAGSAVIAATVVPAAGTLTVTNVNAGTTTNTVTTGTLEFSCIN